jgi:hypothetical protein
MSDRGKTKGGMEVGKQGKEGGRRDPARSRGEKQLAELEKNRLASLQLAKPPPKRPPTQPPASDRTKDPPTPEKRGRQGLRSRDASPAVDVETTTQPPKKPTKTELAKAAARKLKKEEDTKQKLARRAAKSLDEAEAALRVQDALAAAAAEDRASDDDGDESEALLDSSLYKEKDVEEEPNPKDEAEDNPPSSEGEASSDDPRDLAFKPRRGELDDAFSS